LTLILRHNPRQRHSLIIAQRHFAPAVVLKAIDQFLIVADFAIERFSIFDDRRLQRLEAVPLEDGRQRIDDVLPQDHRRWQMITHASNVLNPVGHGTSLLCGVVHGCTLAQCKKHEALLCRCLRDHDTTTGYSQTRK